MKTVLKKFLCVAISLFSLHCYAGPNEDLLSACMAGDLNKAKQAIDAGADVNHIEKGNPPIVSAFFWPDITKLLLEKGANPNLGNYPALFQASMNYSPEVVKLLLDAGADPNKPGMVDPAVFLRVLVDKEKSKGAEGNQALIKAWESAILSVKPQESYIWPSVMQYTGCVQCMELLLAKGVKDVKNNTDGNLLHVFAASQVIVREEWIKNYAQAKSNIEAFGLTLPEWYSTLAGDRLGTAEQKMELLLKYGKYDINQKNSAGKTPLEVALNTGLASRKEVIISLINHGADVKTESKTYGPLIFQAAQTGLKDVVKAMVEKGADINAEGQFFGQTDGALLKGYTPLTIAAYKNHSDLVKYLIGAGAKTDIGVEGKFFNAKTSCLTKVSDKTAIYYAIENGNVDLVKYMIETDVKWWKRIKIYQIKQNEMGHDIMGNKVTVITCFDAGEYTPSMYVNAITKNKSKEAGSGIGKEETSVQQLEGLKELAKVMKEKGI